MLPHESFLQPSPDEQTKKAMLQFHNTTSLNISGWFVLRPDKNRSSHEQLRKLAKSTSAKTYGTRRKRTCQNSYK